MDSIKDFITDWSIMGAILKIVIVASPFLIRQIAKLVNLRKDMEGLKLIIDGDKKQIATDRANTKEDMEYAKKYRDEARADKIAIEQMKEDITKKVEAVNSQLSSARSRAELSSIGGETERASREKRIELEKIAEIVKKHLKPY